jgi:hypothetical protein
MASMSKSLAEMNKSRDLVGATKAIGDVGRSKGTGTLLSPPQGSISLPTEALARSGGWGLLLYEDRCMNAVWVVSKIAIYTFVLSVLYRQSSNFLFILAHLPKTWIAVVGALGALNMAFAYALGWDPALVSAAALGALLFNIAPVPPKGHTKEEWRITINEAYQEMGLPSGRLQSRLGLLAFGLCSLISYVAFFTQTCDINNECTPLFRGLI